MTRENSELHKHDACRILCALSLVSHLTESELGELRVHMLECEECRRVYNQYRILRSEGMSMLAGRYELGAEDEEIEWDDSSARRKVLERMVDRKKSCHAGSFESQSILNHYPKVRRQLAFRLTLTLAAVACLILVAVVTSHRTGQRVQSPSKLSDATAGLRTMQPKKENERSEDFWNAGQVKLEKLQEERAKQATEIEKLQVELLALRKRESSFHDSAAAAKISSDEELRAISQEKEVLSRRLGETQQAYQSSQAELANLRAELVRTAGTSASLQSQVGALVAENQEQRQRLESQDRYLFADRDIRELMGARQLYIADVYDVSSDSHTRGPYGRVFYTKGKSLIFYAFDLDRQPGLKNARAFQVWGKNESDQGRALNLGILYEDNEANRRWALRCDDPAQLAKIDAVFVTVEPSGGSNKPTGKPFLFASLRKEANHP